MKGIGEVKAGFLSRHVAATDRAQPRHRRHARRRQLRSERAFGRHPRVRRGDWPVRVGLGHGPPRRQHRTRRRRALHARHAERVEHDELRRRARPDLRCRPATARPIFSARIAAKRRRNIRARSSRSMSTDGSVRWSYQTVHHDIWDYDVPSQPTLVDLPQADGSVVPALIQADQARRAVHARSSRRQADRRGHREAGAARSSRRRMGREDAAVLGRHAEFRGPDIPKPTCGASRRSIRCGAASSSSKLRYEGHFTPPSIEGTLVFPGNAGGFNWGSVAIDEEQQLLVVTPLLMASRLSLIPRAQVPKDIAPLSAARHAVCREHHAVHVAARSCPASKPPYGRIAVIDLQTRQIVWNQRLGTTNESGPLGTKIGLSRCRWACRSRPVRSSPRAA